MMHELTIKTTYCRGLGLCHACESIMPGLALHIERHGRLLISGPSTGEHGGTISRLIQICPDRAIHVRPVA